MTNDIKEIKFIEYNGIEGYIELMKHDVEPLNNPDCKKIELYYNGKDIKALLDYITNLQNQLEEKTYLYNKLDTESKYTITNLQEEVNKLTAESTEWENRTYHWQDKAEVLQEENNDLKDQVDYQNIWREEYLNRIDKAIEYIKQDEELSVDSYYNFKDLVEFEDLLNILEGDDK